MKARVIGFLFCAVSCVHGVAGAQQSTSVVLASFAEPPPEEAWETLAQMPWGDEEDALLFGAALRERIDAQISRDAGPLSEPAGVRLRVEQGRRQFIEGEYDKAIATLTAAKQDLLGRVQLLTSDHALREVLQRALLVLAHAYYKKRELDAASEQMGEAIRTFPQRDVPLATFGPELAGLYRRTQQRLERTPTGRLTVTTVPADVPVYVNERMVGVSPVTLNRLQVGSYRVVVGQPGRQGRFYQVEMRRGEDYALMIDYAFDLALRTTPEVHLVFEDEDDRHQRQHLQAAKLGGRLRVKTVVLIEWPSLQGRHVMTGYVISVGESRVTRTVSIPLRRGTQLTERLAELMRRLREENVGAAETMTGVEGEGGRRQGDLLLDDKPSATDRGLFSGAGWRWVAAGAALGAIGGGVYLMIIDGKGTCTGNVCPDEYNTMPYGIGLVAAGGLAAIASGILFYVYGGRGSARADQVAWRQLFFPWASPDGAGIAGIARW